MTLGLFTIVGVGFLVGFRHAFEPDHLAAVTTLASHHGRWGYGARLGVAWGIGHTLSVALVAIVLIVLGIHVPPSFYRAAEMGVAILLVLLGVSSLMVEARRHRALLGQPHTRAHQAHAPHSHDPHIRSVARSLWFGVAHGLAGSGGVIVLLVASATTIKGQFACLAAFGLGTVAGMSVVSLLTSAASGLAVGRDPRLAQRIRVGAALTSSLVGFVLGWSVALG